MINVCNSCNSAYFALGRQKPLLPLCSLVSPGLYPAYLEFPITPHVHIAIIHPSCPMVTWYSLVTPYACLAFPLHAPCSPGIPVSLPMHALHSPIMPHVHLAFITLSRPMSTVSFLPVWSASMPKGQNQGHSSRAFKYELFVNFFGSASGILE